MLSVEKPKAALGKWRAHLEIEERVWKKVLSGLENQPQLLTELRNHRARFGLNVHSSSNLRMKARLHQSGNEPGATMTLRAVLTEYGIPVDQRANVRAELKRPDGTTAVLNLVEVEPGVFETELTASLSGVYQFRVLANGTTLRGLPFTREHLVTGAVWQGGDQPLPTDPADPGQKEELCWLLYCLLDEETVRPELRKHLREIGLEVEAVRQCLERYCRERPRPAVAPELQKVFKPQFAALLGELKERAKKK